MSSVAGREDDLIEQIERDALDESVPLATALRKCVVLGGKSGSEELRDWATRELKGYYGEDSDKLPDYRVVPAPLMLDGVSGNVQIRQQQLAPTALPDFAQEHIKEEVQLRDGVGGIEALLQQAEIKLMPKMAADLARVMNADSGNPFQQIVSIYWAVSPAAVRGVLDQIRTSLAQLVAELRATMSSDDAVPSAEAANQAVEVVVSGRRSKVNVTTAQATGTGSTAATTASDQPGSAESGSWTRGKRIGGVVVGLATIAAAVFAAIEVF